MVEEFKVGDLIRYKPIASSNRVFKIMAIMNHGDLILGTQEESNGRRYDFYARDCELIIKTPKSLMTW